MIGGATYGQGNGKVSFILLNCIHNHVCPKILPLDGVVAGKAENH
jgi:hypothetical protein